jgi:glycine/serine hydroxymethyltransferase
MSFSEFVRDHKSANMIAAHERMTAIESSSFPQYKREARTQIMRSLKTASKEFLNVEVKDYKEVIANLARRLKGG